MTERRRLSDKIIDAHQQAVAEGKTEVAELLIRALETELSAIGGSTVEQRETVDEVASAFERHQQGATKSG